jgi:hypothetical protein
VFIAQYRVGGGRGSRQRRYTLGVFGKITAEDARAKAKDVLARAHLGEDTAEERDKVRRSQTVAQLIDEWSKGRSAQQPADRREATAGQYRQ